MRSQLALHLAVASAFVPAVSAEPGLLGDYYNDAVPPPFGGTPGDGDFVRVDESLDFYWGGDAPDGTGGSIAADDKYSERWTGYVLIEPAGDWTFTTTSNDGIRLWVDNQLIIEDWTQHAAKDDSAMITLPAADWYPIMVEHFNDGGTATVKLYFQGSGQPTKVIIPPANLDTTFLGLDPPAVDAGADHIIVPPQTSTTLLGSATDEDGIRTVTWFQLEGPPTYTIVSPNNLVTEVSFTDGGIHVFRLTATDTTGASAYDDVTVYVVDPQGGGGASVVSGTLKKWHKASVTFDGEEASEDNGPDNPFRNYRLQVLFVHPATGTAHDVPGFFAADGDAAETSATAGTKWRAHFSPDETGTWYYLASFRTAPDVAASLDPFAGSSTSFDGSSGTFEVGPYDPTAPGFLRHGLLQYVGEHHLRFAESGMAFLKGGADSPENFLAYYEFDDTFDLGGNGPSEYPDGLHHYDYHFDDYANLGGGPLWQESGKGKHIIGALNYLSSKGMNSVYFLTYNIDGGDGRDVWPWNSQNEKYRYDCSKLDQWGIVLDHMTESGLALNLITQETENDQGIDGGNLGVARKIYYRELVARFGHNLALVWNLGEENTNTDSQRKAFSDYIKAVDPYDHPITVHTYPGQLSNVYTPLLGYPNFDGPSMQIATGIVHSETKDWVDQSAANGHPWFVCNDEQTPANTGVVPDASDFWHDTIRKQVLWGNIMGQGSGVEYYFGYGYPHSDMTCEDWRSRDHMWSLTAYALDFFNIYLPFAEMAHGDDLTSQSDDYVLAMIGQIYVVYRPNGGGANLDLPAGNFSVDWYDPRNGGDLQTGSLPYVASSGGSPWIGTPPSGGDDWVALVRNSINAPPVVSAYAVDPDPRVAGDPLSVQVWATDPNGPHDIDRVELHVWGPDGTYVGKIGMTHVGGNLFAFYRGTLGALSVGTWTVAAAAFDKSGAFHYIRGSFESQ